MVAKACLWNFVVSHGLSAGGVVPTPSLPPLERPHIYLESLAQQTLDDWSAIVILDGRLTSPAMEEVDTRAADSASVSPARRRVELETRDRGCAWQVWRPERGTGAGVAGR